MNKISEASNVLVAETPKYVKHMILPTPDAEIILPLCIPVEQSPVATPAWKDVTCIDCLELFADLINCQTHNDARTCTCTYTEHEQVQEDRVVGATPQIYWRSMRDAGIIDNEGNLIQGVQDAIRQRIHLLQEIS